MSELEGGPTKRLRISDDTEAALPNNASLLSYQNSCLAARLQDKNEEISQLNKKMEFLVQENSKLSSLITNVNSTWAVVIPT